MSVLPVGFGSSGGLQITNSVRLRAAASAYFSRTFGAPTTQNTFTYSTWFKSAGTAVRQVLLSNSTGTEQFYIEITTGIIKFFKNPTTYSSTAVLRDPSAHMHIVMNSNGTTLNVWVNNQLLLTQAVVPASLNGNGVIHYLGRDNSTNHADGVQSDPYWVDGQALTPSSFGETDSNGVWVPKAYTGTYGTNGFHLDFKDAALTAGSNVGLGKDVSGNGNYWTTNNISVTAGVTYDSMVDTPTNNYATLNPIIASAANISYAALRSGTTAVQGTQEATAFAGAYWEVTAAGSAVTAGTISGTGTTNTTTVTANKVFGFRLTSGGALDYINITDAGSWTSITTGLSAQQFPYGITQAADWNFGQRPFIGTASGKALCTANLPNGSVTTSGSFTGTLAADGPVVWLNGCPTAMTINGNAVTFGTHADKTAGGFKLRTASASYNNTGSNTYSVSTNAGRFNIPQTAQGNP